LLLILQSEGSRKIHMRWKLISSFLGPEETIRWMQGLPYTIKCICWQINNWNNNGWVKQAGDSATIYRGIIERAFFCLFLVVLILSFFPYDNALRFKMWAACIGIKVLNNYFFLLLTWVSKPACVYLD
jgi:hypothetical protein